MADLTLAECQALIKVSELEFYVYVLVNPDSGAPFYVGKGSAQRISKHERETRSGRRGHRFSIIRGIWNGGNQVIYRLEGCFCNEDEAFAAEMRVIASIGRRANGGPLVNKTDGGEGPSGLSQIITPETRAKISAALKGRKKDPDHVAKVAAKRRGCIHDAESRAKISEAVRRPDAVAKIAVARVGFVQSEAAKAKISSSKKGSKHSAATKLKMSVSQSGRRHSPEAMQRMSNSAKFSRPPMSEETKAKIRAARANQAPISAEGRAKCAEAARVMRARQLGSVQI